MVHLGAVGRGDETLVATYVTTPDDYSKVLASVWARCVGLHGAM